MKITQVKVTVVAVPDPPLRNCLGVHEPFALRNIVQVETDEGIVGLGEMPGGKALKRRLENLAQVLIGLDPFHLEVLRQRLMALPDTRPKDYAAFEVPCLDIQGKALNRSVADLLGGVVRNPVPFSAYLFYKFERYEGQDDDWGEILTPEAMLGEARRFVERYGFKTLKLKGGVLPPEEEVRTLRLLREHFGSNYRLRFDPNASWSLETTLRWLPALEELELEYLEDPVAGQEAMAEVQKRTRLPLATNMCVTEFAHFPPALRLGSVKVILGDHHYWGGLWAMKTLGHYCATFGLGMSQHSNTHLGISMAAMIHAAATTPQLTFASDTHYPWQEGHDIIKERFTFEDGCLKVPSGPGLGVTLDEERLHHYAEIAASYLAEERNDVAAMRRFIPEWTPRKW
jgi:glucarate dehydratase